MSKHVPKKISRNERFERHYHRLGENDCWPWLGCRKAGHKHKFLESYVDNYGMFMWARTKSPIHAHVAAWLISNGKIKVPKGKNVLHSCNNPPCVNPRHLFAGTSQQNTQQAFKEGRLMQPGQLRRKLTSEQVSKIKSEYKKGEVGYRTLSKTYKVDPESIRNIIKGRTYKEVE